MAKLQKIIEKCERQKTISTHLILDVLKNQQRTHTKLQNKHKELQHYANKHQQLMKQEIQYLKNVNKQLKEKVDSERKEQTK